MGYAFNIFVSTTLFTGSFVDGLVGLPAMFVVEVVEALRPGLDLWKPTVPAMAPLFGATAMLACAGFTSSMRNQNRQSPKSDGWQLSVRCGRARSDVAAGDYNERLDYIASSQDKKQCCISFIYTAGFRFRTSPNFPASMAQCFTLMRSWTWRK